MTADLVHLVIVAVRWSALVFYWTGVVVWCAFGLLSVLSALKLVTRLVAWLCGATRDDVLLLKRQWQVRGDVAEWQRGKR